MVSKFDLDVPVYWLTVDYAHARHRHMINQCFRYGIDSHTLVQSHDINQAWSMVPDTKYPNIVDTHAQIITLSHLKIIEQFYRHTTSDMALIFEDDIDLSLSDCWQFALSDLVARLPSNWAIVQLCLVRGDHQLDVKFRHMWDSDWSLAAYLISRPYAARLLDTYVRGHNCYNLDLVRDDFGLMPFAEAVLFCLDWSNMYTFPLMTECLSLNSTFHDQGQLADVRKSLNQESAMTIANWWKTVGVDQPLDYFFRDFG